MLFAAALFLGLSLDLRGQDSDSFTYTSDGKAITITSYTGAGGAVTIPATLNGLPVMSIGAVAFADRKDLTQVILPDGITSIGSMAFAGCTGLIKISLGQSLLYLDDGLFWGCYALEGLTIPDSVQMVSVDIRPWMPEITVFKHCTGLRHVHLGRAVLQDYGSWSQAFGTCNALTSITVADDHPACRSIEGVLFNRDTTSLLFVPRGRAGRYEIPDGVASVAVEALANCRGLSELILPGSLRSIAGGAFSGCAGLTIISIPNGVMSIGGGAFFNCGGLTRVGFMGDPPTAEFPIFGTSGWDSDGTWIVPTVLYLPGTTAWGTSFSDAPTAIWLPTIGRPTSVVNQEDGSFGFPVEWAPQRLVTVEACSDLAQRNWLPVGNLTLDAGGTAQFSDPDSASQPTRLYRLRTP